MAHTTILLVIVLAAVVAVWTGNASQLYAVGLVGTGYLACRASYWAERVWSNDEEDAPSEQD